MNEVLISKLFLQENKEMREFAIKYLLTKPKDLSNKTIEQWFDSIKRFGYKPGDIDIRELFVFFNFSNENAKENFKYLLNFSYDFKDSLYQNDFFFLIYMSSIEIQKLYIKDLKMILTEDQLQIIEDNIVEYENFKDYQVDELFLSLINLLDGSEELDFIDLNHRRIETIINMIIKFPSVKISEYIGHILNENINNYYLNSYLFYINAHLSETINSDDLMGIIIERFNTIKYTILEQAFFVRPIKEIVYKLIENDFQYITLFKYFPKEDILSYYNKLSIKYEEKELFLEYFVKLFIVTMHEDGLLLASKWIKKGLVRNRDVLSSFDLVMNVKGIM